MFSSNCVIVTPAPEISLKSSPVRAFMLNRLRKNMNLNLLHFGVVHENFVDLASRVIISSKSPESVLSSLKNCFGIKYFSLAQRIYFDSLDDLCAKAVNVAKGVLESGTFAVRGKSFTKGISSKQLEEGIGHHLLDKYPKLKVKLKGCEHEFHCLISKNTAYFYFSYLSGAEGMPTGSQGCVGLLVLPGSKKSDLISIGKNLLKFGCNVSLISDSPSESIDELVEFNNFKPLKVFSIAQAKKLYSSGDLTAFFSDSKTPNAAILVSEIVGVKVFAPLLV
ncbi:MAG: THUMP domain-containing protein [archaeon]